VTQFTRPAVAVEGSTTLPGFFISTFQHASGAHTRNMRLFGADCPCDLAAGKFNLLFSLPKYGNKGIIRWKPVNSF